MTWKQMFVGISHTLQNSESLFYLDLQEASQHDVFFCSLAGRHDKDAKDASARKSSSQRSHIWGASIGQEFLLVQLILFVLYAVATVASLRIHRDWSRNAAHCPDVPKPLPDPVKEYPLYFQLQPKIGRSCRTNLQNSVSVQLLRRLARRQDMTSGRSAVWNNEINLFKYSRSRQTQLSIMLLSFRRRYCDSKRANSRCEQLRCINHLHLAAIRLAPAV